MLRNSLSGVGAAVALARRGVRHSVLDALASIGSVTHQRDVLLAVVGHDGLSGDLVIESKLRGELTIRNHAGKIIRQE